MTIKQTMCPSNRLFLKKLTNKEASQSKQSQRIARDLQNSNANHPTPTEDN